MRRAMPPRSSLTSSFSVTDANNEVVCPLRNQDGSICRKRCLGEKRFRSMQEHIRRAHPENYISKLPATEESFALMVNTPPSQRPQSSQEMMARMSGGHERGAHFLDDGSSPATPRNIDDLPPISYLPVASAAAALTSLYHHKLDSDYESEPETMSENDITSTAMTSSIEMPSINHFKEDVTHVGPYDRPNQKPLLPSIISRSPPGRSSTLPPIRHREKAPRPRKPSITEGGRKPKHERHSSRGHGRRMSYDGRKAFSAEPSSAASRFGNRWEDLIDAATTATKEADDTTPVPRSPHILPGTRTSLPQPLPAPSHYGPYHHAPIHYSPPHPPAPPPLPPRIDPPLLPSIETATGPASGSSGEQFHMEARGLDSSPQQRNSAAAPVVSIVCASCRTLTVLNTAYACTECICGICHACVDMLMGGGGGERDRGGGRRRGCPVCGTLGGRFKPFQLELR